MLNVNELFVKNPVVININSVNGINTVNPLTLPSSTAERVAGRGPGLRLAWGTRTV